MQIAGWPSGQLAKTRPMKQTTVICNPFDHARSLVTGGLRD